MNDKHTTGQCPLSHKRLYDLVRYCRANLHQAKLITDDEYARLVETGSESARRLEDYEQAIAAAQKPLVDALTRLTKSVDALEGQAIEYSLGMKLAKDCMAAKAALAKVKEGK